MLANLEIRRRRFRRRKSVIVGSILLEICDGTLLGVSSQFRSNSEEVAIKEIPMNPKGGRC
jgi:hypothetical protein